MKIEVTPKVADYLYKAIREALSEPLIWPPDKEESMVIMQLRELAKETQ